MKTRQFIITLLIFAMANTSASESQSTLEIIGSGVFDVNTTRTYTIDENTEIYKDGEKIEHTLFEIIGSGFKTAFTLTDDVNGNVDSGTINALELITNIRGPVTSLSPISVLEQPVLLTSDTVEVNTSNIELGQIISVSGYLNNNNSLKATRTAMEDLDQWKVRGFITHITPNRLDIGSLSINLSGATLLNCESGINNGTHIEIMMDSDSNYQVGTPIDTIISIECLKLNQLAEESLVLPSVIQGFISDKTGQDFWLNDVKVEVNQNTVYENGEMSFIDEWVNVEVQGVFDTESSEIQADVVRFVDHRIEITFPVEPENIILNESITLLGTAFLATPQTKDNSNILTTGLLSPRQIHIEGYVDSQGIAYLSKIVNNGNSNFNRVSIRGDVNAINNPVFSILSIEVDATNSLIVNQGTGVIDLTTFFNLLNIGSQVEIKNAVYDQITNTFIDGNIAIKKIGSSQKNAPVQIKEIIGSGIIGGFGTATITATPDRLFGTSFE